MLCFIISFGSDSSRITQLSNSHRNVRFNIFEYISVRDYDLFQKWIGLYSWFERHNFTKYLRMNVDPKWPIALNDANHAHSSRFYLHCGIEETCSPGIIHIVCHQVLRHPSEHGSSSMRKHWLAKAHIAKLNELTDSELTEFTSSTVDETALAILKRQGSQGIKIVSSLRKSKFEIHVNPYWRRWHSKCSKLPVKDFETSKFPQGTWTRYHTLEFVSAHIPLNAISYLKLWRSH